ncbi:hypothetical protein [Nitrospirillum viridazoti]|nr:hypothetical protein [Nitrospirillum amazonense]
MRDTAEIQALIADRLGMSKASAVEYADAARAGDIRRLQQAAIEVDGHGAWRLAFQRCARLQVVPDITRVHFLEQWVTRGDDLRDRVNDDSLLLGGLRVLLPRYAGPPVTLYRGDRAFNRRRRSYGMSWSTARDVAEGFARGEHQTSVGGSVLLETFAPPDAIICSPAMLGDDMEEAEYLVDRRRLTGVRVIERFPQRSVV